MERALASARFPIGVATTYSIPGVNRAPSKTVKRAMNPLGARAEALCASLMRAAGLRVLARNWRCRLGEIDLVAEERGMLVFAEVRMRSGPGFGGAGESVTAAKRQRLVAAARLYLARRPDALCRFDVFLVDGAAANVQWIRNAFGE
jgi:putative endonuclease